MIEELNHGHNSGPSIRNYKDWSKSVEELFSDILVEAGSFDSNMKLRFVEAFFYIGQGDLRQAMSDFDMLGDADRLVASYVLRSLGRKAQSASSDLRSAPVRRVRKKFIPQQPPE